MVVMLDAISGAFATKVRQRTVNGQKDALEKQKERERQDKLKQLKPDCKYSLLLSLIQILLN